MVILRGPDSNSAGHLRLEAPSRLRTLARRAPESRRSADLGPPPETPASLPSTIQVCAIAGITSSTTFGKGLQQELCVVSASLDTAETAVRDIDTATGGLQACH